MGKLLFWVVVIIAGLIVTRIINYQKARARDQASDSTRAIRRKAEVMVPCAHCGVYQPESQAVHRNGAYWCSAEHARKGKTRAR